jgi:uncharacterized protein (TIGR00369 family)
MDGFAGRLGVRDESARDGRAELRFTASETHLNPAGTVHGGLLATLVDTAMGLAARSRIADDDVPATSQLTIAYLAPAHPGELRVRAEVRTAGDHLLLCEADIDQDKATIVHAVATFALV